jgi:DNA polymerase III subunit gamma/tau
MLTTEAFNALLKTLEEPPPHVKFVFATTDPQKVPPTILSRCQRFDFRPVPDADVVALLRRICAEEGMVAEEDALVAVARAAAGGMRDAESLLEQLGTLGGGKVLLADLHALLGTVSAERMRRLFDALAAGDGRAALSEAGAILDAGTDPAELLRQCLRHSHDLMLARVLPSHEGDSESRRALAAQAKGFSEATLVYATTLFGEALKSAKALGEARLFAETALARLAGHRDMRYLDQMVRELAAMERRLAESTRDPPAAAASARPDASASTGVPAADPPADAAALASEPQTAAAPSGELTAESLRARWSDLLEAARTAGSRLRTALAAASIEQASASMIVLGFPAEGAFHRAALATPEAKDALAAAIERVFGSRPQVETVERAKTDAPAADEPARPSRGTPPMGERLTAAERAAAEESPLTRLVERELKARIVSVERASIERQE